MMKKGLLAISILVALLAVGGQASATTIAILDSWNVQELNATGDFVTVDLTGDTLTFTLTVFPPPSVQLSPLKGIDEAGWTGRSTPDTNNWFNDQNASGHMDGFGNFNPDMTYPQDASGLGGATGVGTSVSFLLGTGTLGESFAVHVQFGNDCSGFVGNTSVDTHSETGCGSTVPEPASMMLLGAGLAGVGIWQWTKRKSIQA